MGSSRKTEKKGKRHCKDTVKKCIRIKMKQEKRKRRELNISKRRENRHFTDDGRLGAAGQGKDVTKQGQWT